MFNLIYNLMYSLHLFFNNILLNIKENKSKNHDVPAEYKMIFV